MTGPRQHGTAYGYRSRKCRCEKCKEWKRNSNKNMLISMRARGRANPELIPHGTGSGYRNWGCRCELCTTRAVREVGHYQKTGTMVLEEA